MTDLDLPRWPWDTPPRVLLDRLLQQLADRLDRGPVYLLIDPAVGGEPPDIEVDAAKARRWPNGPGEAREAAWARAVCTLHTEDLDDPELEFPYLVRLTGPDDPLLPRSVEWAMQEHLAACARGAGVYRIGGWLQRQSPEEGRHEDALLARQLNRLTRYKRRSARLWDRRVLHLLRTAGTGIDWDGAIQGIRGWHYLDHNFTLHTLAGRPGESATAPLMPGDYDGAAATNAHRLLRHAEGIHRAQTLLLADFFPLSDAALPVLIEKVQSVANSLNYAADRAAYAAEALREPAFEHWPSLDGLLRTIRDTRQELGDVLLSVRHHWSGPPRNHGRSAP